ncbi:MAG: HNH endonuclease [Candidatus Acidiferrales bacterium]
MSAPFPKRKRLRLEQQAYGRLRLAILRRDRWRCQKCGSPSDLHVHHLQARSRSGDDDEENLITLCAACHRKEHAFPRTC